MPPGNPGRFTVSLAVLDAKGSRTLSIVRRPFKPAAPKLQRLPGVRIGLVATAGESGLMLPEMAKSILSAKSDLHGIILDLRKDSGGLLDAYIRTADVFLSQGPIVTVRGHPDELYNAHAVSDPADAFLENVPLVVLVDPVTAAGAEIVVAALQDHRRATVIGQQTFGRGTVQTFFMLGQGWAMKLTTGQLVRPEGSSLSQGVKPDCASDLRDQALIDWVAQRMVRGEALCPAAKDIAPQPAISAQTR